MAISLGKFSCIDSAPAVYFAAGPLLSNVKSLQVLEFSWMGVDLLEDPRELVGLNWTAVVSCTVCSLVSISNAVFPGLIRPILAPGLDFLAPWAGGLRLQMQQAPKKANATTKRIGPMTMEGLLTGTNVPKANAPTRVMLRPASMMHSPQAQHRAGDGKPCGLVFFLLGFWDKGVLLLSLNMLIRVWKVALDFNEHPWGPQDEPVQKLWISVEWKKAERHVSIYLPTETDMVLFYLAYQW